MNGNKKEDLEVVHVPAREVANVDDFMPLLTVEKAVERKGMINQFIGQVLKEGDDYGKMPGDTRADAKKVLLKPGAEKLCSIFGLAPQYLEDKIVEDWTGESHGGEPLFYYAYRCQLMRGSRFMGEAIGSANSWEVKYRYRWITQEQLGGEPAADMPRRGSKSAKFEPDFAIAKRTPEGQQYGHPAAYWDMFTAAAGAKRVTERKLGNRTYSGFEVVIDQTLYRIPNPDTPDIINTLQKMAQKRALVAAVLVVTNCSDAFTQDLEDDPPTDPGPTATGPTGEPVIVLPEELAGLIGPNAPAKGTTTAFEIVKRELTEAFPENGADEYRRILSLNGIKDKGNTNLAIMKALLQCWTLAQQAKKVSGWKPGPHIVDPAPAKADGDWGPGRE